MTACCASFSLCNHWFLELQHATPYCHSVDTTSGVVHCLSLAASWYICHSLQYRAFAITHCLVILPYTAWFQPMSCWIQNAWNVACLILLLCCGILLPSQRTGRFANHCCSPFSKVLTMCGHVCWSWNGSIICNQLWACAWFVWGHLRIWSKSLLNFPHWGHQPSLNFSYFLRFFIFAKNSNSSLKILVRCFPLICACLGSWFPIYHIKNFMGFPATLPLPW